MPTARRGYLMPFDCGEFNEIDWLTCSWCGHEYVHLLAPEAHEVGDDYDPGSPLGNRGSWVDVAVVCEACERVTSVVFGFHKGGVARAAFRRTSPDDEPAL